MMRPIDTRATTHDLPAGAAAGRSPWLQSTLQRKGIDPQNWPNQTQLLAAATAIMGRPNGHPVRVLTEACQTIADLSPNPNDRQRAALHLKTLGGML